MIILSLTMLLYVNPYFIIFQLGSVYYLKFMLNIHQTVVVYYLTLSIRTSTGLMDDFPTSNDTSTLSVVVSGLPS
jgi:hypothetical protein